MSIKSVKNDSENVIFKNNKILEIGGDYKKYPKGQYMGMIKFKKKDFHKMMSFYSKLKNYKIDMTTFLNICIKKKIFFKLNNKNNLFISDIVCLKRFNRRSSDIYIELMPARPFRY